MQECAWTAEPRPSLHSCSSVLDDTINRHVIHYNRRKNAPEPGAFLLDSNDDGPLPVFSTVINHLAYDSYGYYHIVLITFL